MNEQVASLRRRNLELLGQINALDEQKMAAENKLRDAERKSRVREGSRTRRG